MRWDLERKWPKQDYIVGNLMIDSEFFCNTLERPWKNNANNISCIPPGIYEIKLTYSNKFKRDLPLVLGVPNRAGIRFHALNVVSESQGCIGIGENKKKGMILNSRAYENKLVGMLRVSQSRNEKTYLCIK